MGSSRDHGDCFKADWRSSELTQAGMLATLPVAPAIEIASRESGDESRAIQVGRPFRAPFRVAQETQGGASLALG